MVDVLTKEQRQRNMRNIKNKDTKPELILRHALHARGLRYRLHQRKLPGCPDIVFPRYKAVIFVHGCFWHRHGCKYTSTPTTRQSFWEQKFNSNIQRDKNNTQNLHQLGWRVFVVWECMLKGPARHNIDKLCNKIILFLRHNGESQN